jgi:hypothetical protein
MNILYRILILSSFFANNVKVIFISLVSLHLFIKINYLSQRI